MKRDRSREDAEFRVSCLAEPTLVLHMYGVHLSREKGLKRISISVARCKMAWQEQERKKVFSVFGTDTVTLTPPDLVLGNLSIAPLQYISNGGPRRVFQSSSLPEPSFTNTSTSSLLRIWNRHQSQGPSLLLKSWLLGMKKVHY